MSRPASGHARPAVDVPLAGRGSFSPSQQYDLFVTAADRQDDPFDHDTLHAAARIVEVMPRYAHPSDVEYVARWLDRLWCRHVASDPYTWGYSPLG